MTKITRNKIIAIVSFIALAIAMFFLSQIREVSEWFTKHLYFPLANAFGNIFEHLDFAVYEVTFFLLAAAAVILIAFSIYYFVHKNNEKGLSLLTTLFLIVSIFVFIYVSMASTMYNREPLQINETKEVLNEDQVETIAASYFNDFNDIASMQELNEDGSSKCPYSDKELIALLKEEYKRLDSDYFLSYTATPKPIASSYLMNAFSITGMTYIPTFEPGYNYLLYDFQKVLTMAHEIAHTKGVMREDDANEVAYYILITSSNSYLKYVGYLYTCTYMLSALILTNSDMKITIPYVAFMDRYNSKMYWEEKAVFSKLGDWINSLYLKLNSQDGTNSYYSYDEHTQETIIDDEGHEKTVFDVISFSHVQNMLFALYQ